MMTLKMLSSGLEAVPTKTSWYLADLAEAKGKQDLYTRQAPQKLKVLREHALIESAVSSNRIEGVEVDRSRIRTLVFGRPALRDRDEEEIRGYRDALNLIHTKTADLPIDEATILKLHRLCRGQVWDAGKYKEKNVDIIQKYPGGRQRVRFRTVPAKQTPDALRETLTLWRDGLEERWVHPLILLATLNLDFLCVHPFRDGNGRVSRLLLLLSCYQSAYAEFEERLGQTSAPRGAKTEMIQQALSRFNGEFTIRELQAACSSTSLDLIRKVLKQLRGDGIVKCLGRGRNARWRRIG